MHVLGYDVLLQNGTIWSGTPQYASIPQPDLLRPREQQQDDTSTAAMTRPLPEPATNGESLTQKQKDVLNVIGEEATKAAFPCGARKIIDKDTHFVRCVASKTLEGSYDRLTVADVKDAVCSNPDALQQIPGITLGIENFIVEKIGCNI
jgi:hypothetical protein